MKFKATPKTKMHQRVGLLKSFEAHKINPLPYMLQLVSDYEASVSRYIDNFPSKERNACSLRLRNTSSDMRKYIISAVKSDKPKSHLYKLDIECEFLRSEWRYAFVMKYINIHQYTVISEIIQNIGKQIGSWIKNVQNK